MSSDTYSTAKMLTPFLPYASVIFWDRSPISWKECLISCITETPEGIQCHLRHTASCIQWPTTVTSKPNAQSKFKSLTANSNRSQQIQIAHSKFKWPTANSNRPQQIHESAFLLRVEGIFSSVAVGDFNLLWAICNLLWAFGFDVTVVGHRTCKMRISYPRRCLTSHLWSHEKWDQTQVAQSKVSANQCNLP